MSYGNYNDPIRYEAPPRPPQRGLPRGLIVALLVIGFFVCLGLFALLALRSAMQAGNEELRRSLPAAKLHTGKALAWRSFETGSLFSPLDPGAVGGLFSADFDADADDEILRIGPLGNSRLYELDGSHKSVGIDGLRFMMGGVSWDYDRDGISEIVVETMIGDVMSEMRRGKREAGDITVSQVLPVYDLQGRVVTTLPAVAHMRGDAKVADLDGDGLAELIASQPDSESKYGSDRLVCFGKDGQELKAPAESSMISLDTFGDVDGDGSNELISTIDAGRQLVALRPGKPAEELAGWPERANPRLACDLSADGRDEIICAEGQLNPASNGFTEFQFPPGESPESFSLENQFACGDFDGDGRLSIAMVHMQGTLLLFGADGSVEHYEQMGDVCFGVYSAQAAGRGHLILQLTDRLLVYP